MFYRKFQAAIQEILGLKEFKYLRASLIELNNITELKRIFNWNLDGIINDPEVKDFATVSDVNERRLRDAEVLSTVCRNVNKGTMLEIGTGAGHGTALMAINAPNAHLYTVNILPEEILQGRAGKMTTVVLTREEIGSYYRQQDLKNITQIFTNTATWGPNIGIIDLAFIDGCHDAKFVYNDTRKVLKYTKSGSFILWHDFNPGLMNAHSWIYEVCLGIEKLYRKGLIKGYIFHVKDSWTGVYQVG